MRAYILNMYSHSSHNLCEQVKYSFFMEILPPCALSSNLGEEMANKEGLGVGVHVGCQFASWGLQYLIEHLSGATIRWAHVLYGIFFCLSYFFISFKKIASRLLVNKFLDQSKVWSLNLIIFSAHKLQFL